jgi:hypothetical protein
LACDYLKNLVLSGYFRDDLEEKAESRFQLSWTCLARNRPAFPADLTSAMSGLETALEAAFDQCDSSSLDASFGSAW